ncbi:MAG TPA: diacylglycerol kinase family protein [Candidatus Paceibacterota bacterium]|nr:diacylglycerol kinase family protein [Candidatus Paceibacterota bacterium]
MKRWIKSLVWARNGLKTVWKEERNFRIEIAIAAIVVVAGLIEGLTKTEWAFIWIAIAMVLGAEIINTAVEDICNKIEPKEDAVIGKIKDIMAAFVLVSCIVAVFLGIIVFF